MRDPRGEAPVGSHGVQMDTSKLALIQSTHRFTACIRDVCDRRESLVAKHPSTTSGTISFEIISRFQVERSDSWADPEDRE